MIITKHIAQIATISLGFVLKGGSLDYKYLRELLKADGYIAINKRLSKQVGLYPTIILADLMSKEEYFENK